MKLKDSGTIIDPEVQRKDIFGKDCLEVRVTYEAEVGGRHLVFLFQPG
jgi:hypothetical protein